MLSNNVRCNLNKNISVLKKNNSPDYLSIIV